MKMIDENQEISPKELAFIRQLEDFDLTMLISEVHDHGWEHAKRTMYMMPGAKEMLA